MGNPSMRTVIGIRPANLGHRAVDDANGPTLTVWFNSWRAPCVTWNAMAWSRCTAARTPVPCARKH